MTASLGYSIRMYTFSSRDAAKITKLMELARVPAVTVASGPLGVHVVGRSADGVNQAHIVVPARPKERWYGVAASVPVSSISQGLSIGIFCPEKLPCWSLSDAPPRAEMLHVGRIVLPRYSGYPVVDLAYKVTNGRVVTVSEYEDAEWLIPASVAGTYVGELHVLDTGADNRWAAIRNPMHHIQMKVTKICNL